MFAIQKKCLSTAVKHLHESGQPPKELSSETQHQKNVEEVYQ